ncbi:uncharacterized protein LOC107226467 [Neodiprion lecontei]|uniref:Uncharacterized protein LOC107226467 n=1 Tax=Neodiprion lecontei TaxID=441921 RepID=A0A6J0C8Z2_NEOLC|nr:uncharacterized protein LOC107226467 [Neodiprion lecontei]XP_015522775.1 uncharacterized protein LOC107226467 [Neodiprion lecontei]XP_046417776.1 uncharacterized protein LOC124178465 [Neodiprion fabricii]XP_046417778.1 uncharacterized protein LOC124178465 [Neodiprion fabricii]
MSSSVIFLTLVTTLSGIYGARIKELNVPNVVRNGTGPVTLSCVYEVKEDENGLVVKWFHDEDELIYQWIPPMPPQDIGVITGRAEYPEELLGRPRTHSIIRLKEVTIEMGGNYTCSVSTYQEEEMKTARMIVYAPETNVTIHTPELNATHTRLTCTVQGAWPRPSFDFRIDGASVEGRMVWNGIENYKKDGFLIRYDAVVPKPTEPALVECDFNIPMTDYRRRESVVYYPRSHRSTSTSIAASTTPSSSSSSLAPTSRPPSTLTSATIHSATSTAPASSTSVSSSPRTSEHAGPTTPSTNPSEPTARIAVSTPTDALKPST